MAVTKVGETSKKIYNPKYLFITPFTDDKTKGETIYMIGNVIRDSTSITQEEPTTDPVENDLDDAPIVNNVTNGSYTFSANIADMDGKLYADLAGFEVDETSNIIYAPDGYVEKFAEIALVFQMADGKYIAAVLPKVQLNSTVLIESIRSSVGQITIAGTGYNLEVTDAKSSTKRRTPFYLDPDYTLPEGVVAEDNLP